MRKYIELEDFLTPDEPLLRIVDNATSTTHIKLASAEALEYIKNIHPIPNKTIILVLAMTAGEFYGPNRNGDAWPERPLRVKDTTIPEDAVLPRHYKTFETHGNVFRHHINKDPAKSIGKILKAFYNWKMHRVELLLALDNDRAADIVDQINNGKYVAVSMGCKVPYDVCSVCGNKAPSRAQYCDHAKYHMGEFLNNGKRIFVWNPYPVFFDLSMVARPADRLGYMMKKVANVPEVVTSAERGEYIEQLENKVAQLRKLSLISKIMRGDVVATKDDDANIHIMDKYIKDVAIPIATTIPKLPTSALHYLSRFTPETVLSTLGALGMALSTPEFLDYLAARHGLEIPLPKETVARAINLQTAIFDFLQEFPELANALSNKITPAEEKISLDLTNEAMRWIPDRSLHHDFLVKRAFLSREAKPLYTDVATGYTPFSSNVYSFTDPLTGKEYQTTEAAIRRSATAAYDARKRMLLRQALPLAAGTLLSFIPYVGSYIGAPILGSAAAETYRTMTQDYYKLDTPYGPIRYGVTARYGKSPLPFRPTEVTKVSFDHAAILKLAMDYAHCPLAKQLPIPDLRRFSGNTLFEKLGSCL